MMRGAGAKAANSGGWGVIRDDGDDGDHKCELRICARDKGERGMAFPCALVRNYRPHHPSDV